MEATPKVLIDLNVILDVLQYRTPFYDSSAQVLAAAETGRIRATITAHTVTTLFYLIAKERSSQQARIILTDLLQFMGIAPVDQNTITQALALPMPDFEDAVQFAVAVQSDVDYLVTRDVKDYPGISIPVLQPAEMVALL